MPELTGAMAVVTHAARDHDELVDRLRHAGAKVLALPCVRTAPLADRAELDAAIAALTARDWLVVTSRAGADAIPLVCRARVAAVGETTARRLRDRGISVDFVPSAATGAAIAQELPRGDLALLARSDRALPDAPRILRERGFAVREVVAYRTLIGASGDVARLNRALAAGDAVAIFLSSPSALHGLLAAIDAELVRRATLFVSGPTTAATARQMLGNDVRLQDDREVLTDVAHR